VIKIYFRRRREEQKDSDVAIKRSKGRTDVE
jgi:hypothetical protein